MRTAGRLAVLVSLVFAAASVLGGARPSAQAQAPQLAWESCNGSFECATLSVPLDYAQPSGRHIEVALIRAPAHNPEERIGVLVTNPGGPGASGIDYLRGWSRIVDDEVRDRFDLVSFDPRGVGESTPLLCHDGIQRMLALDPHPATADEWAEVRRVTQEFVDLCVERGGDLLPHLGSQDVVRDMDRIREALGEEQLTYVGYSYGTVLGALYAETFPDRVRAMVLDGPVDLSLSADELNITQALGFERALDHFLEDCRAGPCELARDGRDPAAAIEELLARVEEAPIPSSNADRPAGPGEALTGIVSALYSEAFWPSLARAVQSGLDGDGTWLVQMADGLWGRSGEEYDNLFEMYSAVTCLDYAYSRDPAHYVELTERAAAVAPRFGAALGSSSLICGLWPAPSKPIGVPDGNGAPPLLVVGTTGDPATPYEWALAARRDLVTSVLLTYEGEGHTAYAGGSTCIDGLVNAYLLTLATPEDGTTCGLEGEPQPPPTPVAAGLPPRSPSSLLATPGAEAASVTVSRPIEEGDNGAGWFVWVLIGAVLLVAAGSVAAMRRRADPTWARWRLGPQTGSDHRRPPDDELRSD
jgi:pimeloyl-ACP methyl ester carboxylesterase